MIRLFDRNESNFNHNNCILNPLSCYVIEEANGMFEVEIELHKNVYIANGNIIKVPTPRGEQLFRVYRCNKTLKGKKAYARHIFYDLCNNFIINVNLDNISAYTALQEVLNNTETQHKFIGTTDITYLGTASYKRINPIQAIIGADNSILNTWGGNLIRDNLNINIKANSINRGYEIQMGKNLLGIEDDSDESSVKTRLYPIVENNGEIIMLPEKYVDSPYINNYGDPIIYEEKIILTDEQKELNNEEIYSIMRDHCNELYNTYNIDKPIVNYKIDFV
ncbi:MAG: phage endopeptidase, partial [Anaerocolumna sp.]|nr:phage endopeptidase [Anaerocolumna sp.]